MKISIDEWRIISSKQEDDAVRAPFVNNTYWGRAFVKAIDLLKYSKTFRDQYEKNEELIGWYNNFKDKKNSIIKSKKDVQIFIEDEIFLLIWLYINNDKLLTRLKTINFKVSANEDVVKPFQIDYIEYNKYKINQERDHKETAKHVKNRKEILDKFLDEIDNLNKSMIDVQQGKIYYFSQNEGYDLRDIPVADELEEIDKNISPATIRDLQFIIQESLYPSVDLKYLKSKILEIFSKLEIDLNKSGYLDVEVNLKNINLPKNTFEPGNIERRNEEYKLLNFVNNLEKNLRL